MKLIPVSPDEWQRRFSEIAHKAVFNKIKPSDWDRISFAVLAVSDDGVEPYGYLTCRETDHETLYCQYGGMFEMFRNKGQFQESERLFTQFCADSGYKRYSCLVENTNPEMLRFCTRVGLKISGIRVFNGTVLVEHTKEIFND